MGLRHAGALRARHCLAFIFALSPAVACFPSQPGARLAHFEHSSPAAGSAAPLFALPSTDGAEVRLASLLRDRPVVLALGSESCPVFRHRRHWWRPLVRQYGDRVHFLAVYVTEAHPVGSPSPFTGMEWDIWVNRVSGVRVREATSLDQRVAQAARASEALGLPMPVVVDRMDDAVWRAYGAASAPVFVIGRDGRIVARQVWSDPSALRSVLAGLVDDADAPPDEPPPDG